MGGPLRKREFPGQNEKVVTYEAVDSFPKTDFLKRMRLPNPLDNTPEHIEQLQRNCLKVSYLFVQNSGNLLSS